MPDISLRLGKDVIVVDGAMGTMLLREGIPADECGLLLNVLDPELIVHIHARYLLAGAQAITTNSFGGTRSKLRHYGLEDRLFELNSAAVRLARQARPQHILADIGPCGLLLEPLGTAGFDEVFEEYAEQVRALVSEGPDAILIETMADIADARCALLAAKSVCDLPILVSCTFDATGHMELSGTDPETAAVILEAAGASAVGMSTVPEAIVASHCRMTVLGISCIANLASGILDVPLTGEEVIEVCNLAGKEFTRLLEEIIRRM